MDLDRYLHDFGDISKLDRKLLLDEMDKVWDELNLDNKLNLSEQQEKVGKFYGHRVWVLNGLFSELDPISLGHRIAIADYIASVTTKPARIADYGGGSGVLAKLISQRVAEAVIDIVEPYPFEYFVNKTVGVRGVGYVPKLDKGYSALIAQDVLEHVDDPIGLAVNLIESVAPKGYLIFANCFYPDIKCHLPATFYLRHLFKYVIKHAGLKYLCRVPGAEHALVFQKVAPVDWAGTKRSNHIANIFGPILNQFSSLAYLAKRTLRLYARPFNQ